MKILLLLFITLLTSNSFAQSKAKVNAQRIESRIAQLANFGKDNNGKGYRVAYTKGDIESPPTNHWAILLCYCWNLIRLIRIFNGDFFFLFFNERNILKGM